ncbi:MAG: hypothetical protein LUF89_12015 [Ruminococcus sp.]|nr:hypothetical protein [Ruminococcus sp.]
MDAWDIFCMTGHVDDYLHYRQTTGLAIQSESHRKGNPSGGDGSRTDSGTAEQRRKGKIYRYSDGT